MTSKKQTWRRCSCRGPDKKQLGSACLRLATDTRHGSWAFRLEQPAVNGRRASIRRFGFPTKAAAEAELAKLIDRTKHGHESNDRETVEQYLCAWLPTKRKLAPSTRALYKRYIDKDLVPALGALRLEQLTHMHVARLIADLEADGRGPVTVRRIIATLSSALRDAVRRRRLTHNAAQFAETPEAETVERGGWNVADAVGFLAHVADAEDRDAELFEFLIGTGMRKGEALAIRWSDLDMIRRAARVRRTLSIVPGEGVTFGKPKTEGSAAGVGLSKRVIEALHRQRARQDAERHEWGSAYEDGDLVFARENGAPLRPEQVLRRFKVLAAEAGLPVVRVHDLRHLAASLMIAAGVPLTIVSKTLRHSTTRITADTYTHLTDDVSRQAVDAAAASLEAAEAEMRAVRKARDALGAHTPRTQDPGARTHGAHIEGEKSA